MNMEFSKKIVIPRISTFYRITNIMKLKIEIFKLML